MTSQQTPQTSGLAPNVASLLCYLCTFITGIVFLIIEKQDKNVRFHAWQAIVLGAANFICMIVISVSTAILGMVSSVFSMLLSFLSPVVMVTFLIFWIVAMIKAYQGERYKIPVLGDIAEKQLSRE